MQQVREEIKGAKRVYINMHNTRQITFNIDGNTLFPKHYQCGLGSTCAVLKILCFYSVHAWRATSRRGKKRSTVSSVCDHWWNLKTVVLKCSRGWGSVKLEGSILQMATWQPYVSHRQDCISA